MGRKSGFSKPVAVASFSMDPVMVTWLNDYAHAHKTTKSRIVRKALVLFQEKYDPVEVPDDPTRGGRFNPELIYESPWQCTCGNPPCVGGWIICPYCARPREDDDPETWPGLPPSVE